jgi:hypothetical protein
VCQDDEPSRTWYPAHWSTCSWSWRLDQAGGVLARLQRRREHASSSHCRRGAVAWLRRSASPDTTASRTRSRAGWPPSHDSHPAAAGPRSRDRHPVASFACGRRALSRAGHPRPTVGSIDPRPAGTDDTPRSDAVTDVTALGRRSRPHTDLVWPPFSPAGALSCSPRRTEFYLQAEGRPAH